MPVNRQPLSPHMAKALMKEVTPLETYILRSVLPEQSCLDEVISYLLADRLLSAHEMPELFAKTNSKLVTFGFGSMRCSDGDFPIFIRCLRESINFPSAERHALFNMVIANSETYFTDFQERELWLLNTQDLMIEVLKSLNEHIGNETENLDTLFKGCIERNHFSP